MNRRNFINMVGSGAMAFTSSVFAGNLNEKPFQSSKIPLGLCNHSLRGLRLNAKQLLDYAIEQKLDSLLLNTLRTFDSYSLNTAHLKELGKMAKDNNVQMYVGVGSISEKSTKFSGEHGSARELVLEGIRVASLVGSPIVGCRIDSIEDRYKEGGIKVHIDAVVKLMKSSRDEALEAGIKFAFENHVADLRSMELLDLINETGIDICGALYDPANAVWAMEDPLEAFKNLGSAVICTSVRDVHVWETEEGATLQGTAIGKGLIDYPKFAQIMAENCPGVPLQVETISNCNLR